MAVKCVLLLEIIRGLGSKITISISKTRKRTAKTKNRVENGTRADLLGSNPHSKAEDFSRLRPSFIEIAQAMVSTKEARVEASRIIIRALFIDTGGWSSYLTLSRLFVQIRRGIRL